MSDILEKIIATKRDEIKARRAEVSVERLRELGADHQPRGFATALKNAAQAGQIGLIAEIKKASPSKGVIREDFKPVEIAQSYARAGATCLSVLTDEQYFQGSDDHLVAAREAVDLPVIRKDFIVDDYQIYEAKAMGADCVLLIAAALEIMRLTTLNQTAKGLGLDVLIEVHNEVELAAAMTFSPSLIGINNRNLKTFETSLDTTINLLPQIPANATVVTESGIATRDDVQKMLDHNVRCFLVGEAFMKADDPGEALKSLFDGHP